MRIDPTSISDIPWREAQRALDHGSHRPILMLSACSTAPLLSWYCPICASRGAGYLTYSISTYAPTCGGE